MDMRVRAKFRCLDRRVISKRKERAMEKIYDQTKGLGRYIIPSFPLTVTFFTQFHQKGVHVI